MTTFQFICDQFLSDCMKNIKEDERIISFLKKTGIYYPTILKQYQIGFAQGDTQEDYFDSSLIIPLFEREKIINIAGYNIQKHPSQIFTAFNNSGIFNQEGLSGKREIIITDNPIDALLFLRYGFLNTTFIFGDYEKYVSFLKDNQTHAVISIFYGHSDLFYQLSEIGIQIKQTGINRSNDLGLAVKEYLSYVIRSAIPIIFEKKIIFHLN